MPKAIPGSDSARMSGPAVGTKPPRRPWRSRTWPDVRLLIGIGLVLASIAGVYVIVAEADSTTPVFSARTPISVGDSIKAADLEPMDVRLGAAGGLYLARENVPDGGIVATRSIAAGELVPLSAVGTVTGVTSTSVVVSLSGQLAEAVRAGILVDVWAAREVEHGRFGPPAVVIASATVLAISKEEGMMARSGGAAVEILIPKDKVAVALESIANSDAISLVPINRTIGQ